MHESECTTLERWAEANGYDAKRRKYRDTEAKPGAVPGAHCGTHKGNSRMKVG